ncbi:MAG TPA: hypothetical protein VFF79_18855 [Conexibacter sp.]|jgi:hypothetical protein|nr:hypothetical protein [Conexibacter sp.]
MAVLFDIDGRSGALSDSVASLMAENLRCYAAGPSHRFHRDVEGLAQFGVNPSWVEGARAVADIIEDVLVGKFEGAIPLDPAGKAANALMRALSLTGPASSDATSEHARLLNILCEAQPVST